MIKKREEQNQNNDNSYNKYRPFLNSYQSKPNVITVQILLVPYIDMHHQQMKPEDNTIHLYHYLNTYTLAIKAYTVSSFTYIRGIIIVTNLYTRKKYSTIAKLIHYSRYYLFLLYSLLFGLTVRTG